MKLWERMTFLDKWTVWCPCSTDSVLRLNVPLFSLNRIFTYFILDQITWHCSVLFYCHENWWLNGLMTILRTTLKVTLYFHIYQQTDISVFSVERGQHVAGGVRAQQICSSGEKWQRKQNSTWFSYLVLRCLLSLLVCCFRSFNRISVMIGHCNSVMRAHCTGAEGTLESYIHITLLTSYCGKQHKWSF